ncbi:MAG: MBL fold metallo-hydrolase [Methanocella sp.]
MELRILGTAAAEGWPGLFCQCESCQRARRLGGKDLRSRSGALWGTKYLIDFPPDTYAHAVRFGLDLGSVEHLLVTHAHQDHFYPEDLLMRRPPFAHRREDNVLHVYGDAHVEASLAQAVPDWEESGVRFHLVTACEPFAAGELEAVPLPADHFPEKSAFVYLLQHGSHRLFWGLDSGWYPETTWAALEGSHLTAAVIDCTHGALSGQRNHLSVEGVKAVRERLLACGAADWSTHFVATHFSHNGGLSHAELEETFAGPAIQVAFDGFSLDV